MGQRIQSNLVRKSTTTQMAGTNSIVSVLMSWLQQQLGYNRHILVAPRVSL